MKMIKKINLKIHLGLLFMGIPVLLMAQDLNFTQHIITEEFIDGYDRKLFATWEGWDRRLSHLSECNHDVLSDKITRFFNTNELIDLSTEFKKNLFTCKQDCLDYNLDISI